MLRKVLTVFVATFALGAFIAAMPQDASAQKPKKKARRLARQADKMFNQRRYEEALQKYGEAVAISPIFPRARFFKGYSHYNLGQYPLAIEEFNRALAQGYKRLDVVSVRMEAYLQNKDYSAARADAMTAVNLKPKTAYYHSFLGRMSVLTGDYQAGVASLERAISLGERNADTHYFLAVAYASSGQLDEQRAAAQEALRRATSYAANSWYLVADSQAKSRLFEEAAQSYTNAINAYIREIETNRKTVDTDRYLYQSYSDLADVYRNLNRFDDAVTAAKGGLGVRPDDGLLHISLAWYYSLAGRTPEAILAGQKAVQLMPNEYMAHTNLCRAYIDQGEILYKQDKINQANQYFNNANTTCKRALSLEPGDGETNYYLGRSYFYLDNEGLSNSYYKKSVPGLVKFTNENPDYSDGFYLLGNAYFATGDNKNAIKAYEDCLRIAPRFARVRYNLGFVYIKEGDLDNARTQQEKLKELDQDLADRLAKLIAGE